MVQDEERLKKPRALHPGFQWRVPESNWGHKDFQSSALPAELTRRKLVPSVTKYKLQPLPCQETGGKIGYGRQSMYFHGQLVLYTVRNAQLHGVDSSNFHHYSLLEQLGGFEDVLKES